MKVFISAGHGGSDPGAVGNGLLEKDCNLYIALAFGEVLEAAGVNVKYSRTKDENDPVTQEVIEANHYQADYAISFHNNLDPNLADGEAEGSESYYYPGDMKGKALADTFENVIINMGFKSRGSKPTNTLYFIRNTAMTAVLVESAFINTHDAARIDTVAECSAYGEAYGHAFLKYIGVEIPNKPDIFSPFQIKAKNKKLYVYQDHTRNSKVTYVIEDKRRYTVVDSYVNNYEGEYWYKLKSGIGWINADDVEAIKG